MQMFGALDACINLVHRDDAAHALFHVGSHKLPGVFNAIDNHPARRDDLAAAICHGTPVPQSPSVPCSGKRVSNAKLKATSWTPRYPSVLDGLASL
jgi:nucleoside-diphosphate-sugar epimerase